MKQTHTYALLEVSPASYREIRELLVQAGYDHALQPDGEIDMHGIALTGRVTESSAAPQHCETCICGKRAPVQATREMKKGPGSISWQEHLLAWSAYAARYGTSQSAERMAERSGFSYGELVMFLGREPSTWQPR